MSLSPFEPKMFSFFLSVHKIFLSASLEFGCIVYSSIPLASAYIAFINSSVPVSSEQLSCLCSKAVHILEIGTILLYSVL